MHRAQERLVWELVVLTAAPFLVAHLSFVSRQGVGRSYLFSRTVMLKDLDPSGCVPTSTPFYRLFCPPLTLSTVCKEQHDTPQETPRRMLGSPTLWQQSPSQVQ